ncbi:hypothetical protein [Pseudorhodoferax sp.]|uniref:hypothetical protein n=1 Tax=Pseudorhodoferax sp. TaxID=1993553 RepID=UPI0039E42B53
MSYCCTPGSAVYRGVPDEAAMSGRPKVPWALTEMERKDLVALTLRRKTSQALVRRVRIVLAGADGLGNKVVAERRRVTPQMVGKRRGRFVQPRLEGLLDAPRSGAPRTIDVRASMP